MNYLDFFLFQFRFSFIHVVIKIQGEIQTMFSVNLFIYSKDHELQNRTRFLCAAEIHKSTHDAQRAFSVQCSLFYDRTERFGAEV